MELEVHGVCDERFRRVREQFVRNFTERDELGASVAVVMDGRTVVELWAGWRDEAHTIPWQRDTLVVVHSVTKGLVSMTAHMLAARGKLDFDAKVADYWPEFAQNGKGAITVRQAISHQAGIPVLDTPLTAQDMLDWRTMVRAVEAQAPVWPPGTRHGYHAATWGWIIGELIRRVDGRTPGTVLREELARPWGLDFHLGFGPELDHRVSELAAPPPPPPDAPSVPTTPLRERAFGMGIARPGDRRDPRAARAAEQPAGGGHGTALAIARAFGGMARGGELDGVQLLSAGRIPPMWEEQAAGMDEVLGTPSRYGLGFWLKTGELSAHRGERSFAHPGVGGAFGLADPDLKLGFGYAMNRTGAAPRRLALERAVYESVS